MAIFLDKLVPESKKNMLVWERLYPLDPSNGTTLSHSFLYLQPNATLVFEYLVTKETYYKQQLIV